MGSTKDHNLGFTESFGQKNQASKSTWTILLYCHVFVVGLYLANVWATSSTTTPTIKAVRFEVQDLFTTFDLVQLRVRGLGDLTNWLGVRGTQLKSSIQDIVDEVAPIKKAPLWG